jgi:hypothetical protein
VKRIAVEQWVGMDVRTGDRDLVASRLEDVQAAGYVAIVLTWTRVCRAEAIYTLKGIMHPDDARACLECGP